MNRWRRFWFGTLATGSAVVFAWVAPVLASSPRWRDDQVPFGPEGTIGRGTDSASRPPYNVRGGIPILGISLRPKTINGPAALGPYLTNQHLEAGDGYRYPLYYDPATCTYFYYPVQR